MGFCILSFVLLVAKTALLLKSKIAQQREEEKDIFVVVAVQQRCRLRGRLWEKKPPSKYDGKASVSSSVCSTHIR